MLLICRFDYWPGLTPERLWQIPYVQWGPLALAVDKLAADRKRENEEIQAQLDALKR